MLSKNKIKFIRSLEKKKFRSESGCFLAEGNKLVADLLPFFDCELLLARASWLATQGDVGVGELLVAEKDEIERASLLKTPQDVLAVFRQPKVDFRPHSLQSELALALDGVQDPGNFGTIIRLADWFGIRQVVCSPDTADVFNPKTVQATMGALARVKISYMSLPELIGSLENVPVYGAFLDGQNLYETVLSSNGLIVLGNEGNGISPAVGRQIKQRLRIPSFPPDAVSSESLNVAVAAAVICGEFRRRAI